MIPDHAYDEMIFNYAEYYVPNGVRSVHAHIHGYIAFGVFPFGDLASGYHPPFSVSCGA
jgi:hypothetical protein